MTVFRENTFARSFFLALGWQGALPTARTRIQGATEVLSGIVDVRVGAQHTNERAKVVRAFEGLGAPVPTCGLVNSVDNASAGSRQRPRCDQAGGSGPDSRGPIGSRCCQRRMKTNPLSASNLPAEKGSELSCR